MVGSPYCWSLFLEVSDIEVSKIFCRGEIGAALVDVGDVVGEDIEAKYSSRTKSECCFESGTTSTCRVEDFGVFVTDHLQKVGHHRERLL